MSEDQKKITIENIQIGRRFENPFFVTTLSAEALGVMFQNGLIKYFGETQRGTRETKSGKIVDIYSPKHAGDILNAMNENKIYGDLITLNYSKDDNEEEPLYDEEDNSLTLNGSLYIIDGQHRIKACSKMVKKYMKNPEEVSNPANYFYTVNIENLTNKEAGQEFAEFATKGKPISKVRSAFLDVEDYGSQVARYLAKNSDLKDRIETIAGIKKESNKIVKFSTLSKNIYTYFKISTKKEREKTEKYLTEYFDEFVNMFIDKIENNLNDTKQNYLLLNDMFWSAYIYIAKELENDDNWVQKLNRLKDTININGWEGELLSKENPLWQPIMHDGNKIINKTSTQKYVLEALSSYMIKDIPELIQRIS